MKDVLELLDRLDRCGVWILTAAQLRMALYSRKAWTGHGADAALPAEKTMLQGVARLAKQGLVVRACRGYYVNPRARSLPIDVLRALIPYLRPWGDNYVSLESALSESGVLSQVPSRLTVMTTGRRGVFETSFGVVEFVHIDRVQWDLVVDDGAAGIATASPQLALQDLYRVRGRRLVRSLEIDDSALGSIPRRAETRNSP